MVFAYSKMGQVIALNAEKINSFCLPYWVEVSAFKMLGICFALVMMTFICYKNVSFRTTVIPRILGVLFLVVFGCLI